MKKLFILALIASPFVGIAQNTKTTTTSKEASKDAPKEQTQGKTTVSNPEVLYLELIISESSVGSSIRVDYGKEILNSLQDKEQIGQLTELRSTSLTNVPDAMNYLASLGYKYLSSYNTVIGGKTDTHLLFEKRMGRKPNGNGQGSVDRPATNPKPEERPTQTPASKPDVKGKSEKK